jgi:hypothetical protein
MERSGVASVQVSRATKTDANTHNQWCIAMNCQVDNRSVEGAENNELVRSYVKASCVLLVVCSVIGSLRCDRPAFSYQLALTRWLM